MREVNLISEPTGLLPGTPQSAIKSARSSGTPRKSPLASLVFWKKKAVSKAAPIIISASPTSPPHLPTPVPPPQAAQVPAVWSAPSAVAAPRCHIGAATGNAASVGLKVPADNPASCSRLRSYLIFPRKSHTIPKTLPPLPPAAAPADATVERAQPLTPTAHQSRQNTVLLPAVPVIEELSPAPPSLPLIHFAATTHTRYPAHRVPTEAESPLKSALSRTHSSRCTSPERIPRRTVHFANDSEENVECPAPAAAVQGALTNLGSILTCKLQSMPLTLGGNVAKTVPSPEVQPHCEVQAIAQPVRTSFAPQPATGSRGRSDACSLAFGRHRPTWGHTWASPRLFSETEHAQRRRQFLGSLPAPHVAPAGKLSYQAPLRIPGHSRASASFIIDQQESSSDRDAGPSLPATAKGVPPYGLTSTSPDESATDESKGEHRSRWERPVGPGHTLSTVSGSGEVGRTSISTNGAGARSDKILPVPRQLAAEARHAARMAAALQTRQAELLPLPRPVQIAVKAAYVPLVPARCQVVALPGPLTPTIAARKMMLKEAVTQWDGRLVSAPTTASAGHARSIYVRKPDPRILAPAWQSCPMVVAGHAALPGNEGQVDWRAQRAKLAAARLAGTEAPTSLLTEAARRRAAEAKHIERMAAAVQCCRLRNAASTATEGVTQQQPRKAAAPQRRVVSAPVIENPESVPALVTESRPPSAMIIAEESPIMPEPEPEPEPTSENAMLLEPEMESEADPEPTSEIPMLPVTEPELKLEPEPEPEPTSYSPIVPNPVPEHLAPVLRAFDDASSTPLAASRPPITRQMPPVRRAPTVAPLTAQLPSLPLQRTFLVVEPPPMISPNRFSSQFSALLSRRRSSPSPVATHSSQQAPPPFPSVLDLAAATYERRFSSVTSSSRGTSDRHISGASAFRDSVYQRPLPVAGYPEPEDAHSQVPCAGAALAIRQPWGVADREARVAEWDPQLSRTGCPPVAVEALYVTPPAGASLVDVGVGAYLEIGKSSEGIPARPPTPPGGSDLLTLRTRFSNLANVTHDRSRLGTTFRKSSSCSSSESGFESGSP